MTLPTSASNAMPLALYTVAQLRTAEQAAQALLPAGTLMSRAGAAAAALVQQLLMQLPQTPDRSPRILIIAGPGNNGGDALEVACRLHQSSIQVRVLLHADPRKYSDDARHAWERTVAANIPVHSADEASHVLQQDAEMVIDGLFGIGLTRPVTGAMRDTVEAINRMPCLRLALDVPSGLDADSGLIIGPDGVAVQATHTITFIGNKPGLHTGQGRDYAGQVSVASLDIDCNLLPTSLARLNSKAEFAASLVPRRHATHKGSYGDLIVLGGATGMAGAPLLSARAAAKCGAGRVLIGFIGPAMAVDPAQPELMCREATSMSLIDATLVAGPGMGDSREATDLLARVLAVNTAVVLDADALNLIAAEPGLRDKLRQRPAAARNSAARHAMTIMTPHPLEAARLLCTEVNHIQRDRLNAARTLAADFNAVVVLKGSGTVIAAPDEQLVINPTGNPALATAGSGDVLAGICGALLAQGWGAWQAACGAVWLHGAAADRLVETGVGPIGMVATELIPVVRSLLNEYVSGPAR